MSVYGTVQCEISDLERLAEACKRAGLGDRVVVYPDGTGVFRKYSGHPRCEGGVERGRNAHLVIHGGLDTSGNYITSNHEIGGTGDTAFVFNEDGSVTVELDVNWFNAKANWELIQNYYAIIGAERRAAERGMTIKLEVDPETGKIVGQVIQARPTASRTTAKRARSTTTRRVATR